MKNLLLALPPIAFLFILSSHMNSGTSSYEPSQNTSRVLSASQDRPENKIETNISHPKSDDEDFRKLTNKAFTVGEKLDYDIYYGPIVAGSATIATPSYEYYENRKCYKVEFTMRSAKFFDLFFKVRDYYYSLIDTEGLFPWKFEQHIREGGYKKDFVAWFNQVNHTAKTSEGGPYKIEPYTQDIVSTFFYARTIDYDNLRIGQKIHFENFYKDKVYPLDVKYLGQEDVETKAGKFHCQIIEPIIVKGGLFKTTGRIVVWLTDDSLKIPVKVQSEVAIGSVVAELTGYSGLAGIPTAKY
ncbi:MAG: DUF3108 domain-containing protein [Bacteroidetes bacterium]|nr:DUF3108 domain-containing protein [Bacteroidota bacterium]MCL5737524.1 DUF3108 domain-containing protein [Bacteroidota bacterium]